MKIFLTIMWILFLAGAVIMGGLFGLRGVVIYILVVVGILAIIGN